MIAFVKEKLFIVASGSIKTSYRLDKINEFEIKERKSVSEKGKRKGEKKTQKH